jgi:hypothetical protein
MRVADDITKNNATHSKREWFCVIIKKEDKKTTLEVVG